MRIRTKLSLTLLACIMLPLIALAAVGYNLARNNVIDFQMKHLETISKYKLLLIAQFYAETRRSVEFIQALREVRSAAGMLSRGVPAPVAAQLDAALKTGGVHHGLTDVELLSPEGDMMYALNATHRVGKRVNLASTDLFEHGKRGLYFDKIYAGSAMEASYLLAVSAPLTDTDGRLLGVVVCEFDVESLYSVINDGTGLGETGETLLGRIEGDEVLIINPLRHDQNAAFSRIISLPTTTEAGLDSRSHTGHGIVQDYRGKRVLALWRPVPEFNLGMMQKVDLDEALADTYAIRDTTLLIIVSTGVGAALLALLLGNSLARPLRGLHRAAEELAAGNLDYRIRSRKGSDELGQLIGVFDRMAEARKRAEADLRESEERFRAVFESSPVGIATADLDSLRFLLANRKFGEMLEYTADELSALRISEVTHPDDWAEQRLLLRSLQSGETSAVRLTKRYQSKQGRIVPAEVTLSLIGPSSRRYCIGVIIDVSSRLAAEQALRESERRYRLIVETAQEGIWWIDAAGMTVFANPRMAEILGWTSEEMSRQPYTKFMDSTVARMAGEALGRLRATGALHAETRLRRKDGCPVWTLLSLTAVRDERGSYQGAVAMASDITARKRVEKALIESETRYRRLIETANDAIFIVDAESGTIIDVNRKAEILLALPAERIVGMHQSELHPPEETERYATVFRKHVATGRDIADDLVVCRSDGSRVPVDISAKLVEFGKRRVILGIFRDITERQKLMDQLRKLSRAVGQSQSAVIISDAAQTIEYINPKAAELSGYGDDELIGKNLRVLRPPDGPREVYRRLTACMRQGKDWRGDLLSRRKDGGLFWTRTLVSPIRDAKGVVTHYLTEMEDITELKRDEEHRRMQQEKLAHAGRLVTLGEMASALAHEINQPLAAIANYSRGCVHTVSTGNWNADDLVQALQELYSQAIRAGKVVQAIRSFVKRRPSAFERLDLNEVVSEALELARIEARGVNIRLELSADLPPVSGDRVQLQQVLLNLFRNGVEAMADTPENQRLLRVRTERGEGELVVLVEDRGCGLPAAMPGDHFQPFFSTKQDGMGLGLTISRNIIEVHRGRVWATANAEKGTTFCFSLPLREATIARRLPVASPVGN